MHIPYYGEESKSGSSQKPKQHRNKLVALIVGAVLAVQGHPVLAEQVQQYHNVTTAIEVKNTQLVDKAVERIQVKLTRDVEEVLVTAKRIDLDFDKKQFVTRAGLTAVVLVHEFDDRTRTWRYIKTN